MSQQTEVLKKLINQDKKKDLIEKISQILEKKLLLILTINYQRNQ